MRPTKTRQALIHNFEPPVRGWPSIPLIGLAEASVLRGLRDNKMKMGEIARAVDYLRLRDGEYALGCPGLMHDGVSAFVESTDGVLTLIGGQGLLTETVADYLRPFTLAPDGFVQAYVVPRLSGVEIDPRFVSGRMRFTRTGVPVFAVAGLLEAGDETESVADEYELRVDEVELVREHLPWLSQVA